MKFFDLELNDRLKNFSKLWAKDEDLEVIKHTRKNELKRKWISPKNEKCSRS